MLDEMQQLVDGNEREPVVWNQGHGPHAFAPDWQNLALDGPDSWRSLQLLNKGQFDDNACRLAPRTCEALGSILPHLMPTEQATNVGCRLVRLSPGAALRPHRGPGGRLVAHLGVRVPQDGRAEVTVERDEVSAVDVREHVEGQWFVFDDEHRHFATNRGSTARYVLHLTFPDPSASSGKSRLSAPILTVASGQFSIAVFANCTVQTTISADPAPLPPGSRYSSPEPLVTMYNRVSDNLEVDAEPCKSAALVNGKPNTVRVTPTHSDYGTLDISLVATKQWVTFEVGDISTWTADPKEKHLAFGIFYNGLLGAGNTLISDTKLQGQRGIMGEVYSAGFFTLKSSWQNYNLMLYAKTGDKLAFTVAETVDLPLLWSALGTEEGLEAPTPNRAKSWLWTETTAATLNSTIAHAQELGAEMIFMMGFFPSMGEYTPSPALWPGGFADAAKQIESAGLQIGLHMISPGASIGNPLTVGSPELFVPPGMAPNFHYAPTDVTTWHGHDRPAAGQTLISTAVEADAPGAPNNLKLTNVASSTAGRFFQGSALGFDGTSIATLDISAEQARYHFNSTFSVQMVVHTSANVHHDQVLASKPGAWKLVLNQSGLAWHVNFGQSAAAADWVSAVGPPLTAGSWVVKATVAAPVIRLHLCELLAEEVPESTLLNRCNMTEQASANASAGSSLPNVAPENITFGAEYAADGSDVATNGLIGALEEIFISKVDTSSWTRYNWNVPPTGITNFYLWDYTSPKTRLFWANSLATLYNNLTYGTVGAGQWDGAEFHMMGGWDLPHSKQTLNSGVFHMGGPSNNFPGLWGGAMTKTFGQAHALWDKKPAIEMSLLLPGLAPWRGDMTPFADEGFISDFCGMNFTGTAADSRGGGGLYWQRAILARTSLNNEVTNAYNTNVNNLPSVAAIDCFLGGLVVSGVPPQMLADYPEALAKTLNPRVKHWLDLSKFLGHNTESSVAWARTGSCVGRCVDQAVDSVFAISYADGTASTRHVGIYAASTGWANVSSSNLTSGTTFVVFNGNRTSAGENLGPIRMRFGEQAWSDASIRGGSTTQVELGGGFLDLTAQQLMISVIYPNGTEGASSELFASPVTGRQIVRFNVTVDEIVHLHKH